MELVIEILASVTLLLGAFLIVASGIGLVRFPDVYCRMHATGKAGTLGVVMVILGTMIYFLPRDLSVFFRGVLAILFQFITTPAATHLLARACYLSDHPQSDRTALDELKTYLPSKPDDWVGGEE